MKWLDEDAPPRWLRSMIAELRRCAPTPYAPTPGVLADLIYRSRAYRELRAMDDDTAPAFELAEIGGPIFSPIAALRDTGVFRMATVGEVANWLNLPIRQLEWLADIEGFRSTSESEATRHYHYSWRRKPSGRPRLIEAPKHLLKGLQRKILRDILDAVPVHDAAHAFRRGRSCLTAAARHAGEDVVLAMDLKDFFNRVPLRRVHGLFRCLGYPWEVARVLASLCTTATPRDVIENMPATDRPSRDTAQFLQQRHVPQGAPTSPAIANLCAWRLDGRLEGLAKGSGARYTRYADDLAFSGDRDFAKATHRFEHAVARICEDSGFPVNPQKTRVMHQGSRQRLLGMVVNSHINIARDTYDTLKATLWNCIRHGPESQNREDHADFRAHLDGRVTWVENVNPRRGYRLRQLFQHIAWQ